ncbi:MAG: CDP-diacylglycerol--serine O-phosphatidyltransferase [Syntrophomonadales bacterium]|jgi:CDP-diacylglycerol--serine O-phosphatidyltransferase
MMFLPSAVTLMNLGMGVLSLMFTFNHQVRWAAVFVLIAVVLDFLDGTMARKLNASSDFGKELDSLADLVSFGVAPVFLALGLLQPFQTPGFMSGLAIAAGILYILCGAYRLARFNVLNISDYFIGVPITAAGGLMALLVLSAPGLVGWVYVAFLILLSYLMVSRITVPKLLKRKAKDYTV